MLTITLTAYAIAIAVPFLTVFVFAKLDVFATAKPGTILLCMAWGATGAFGLAWGINNAALDQGLGYDTLSRIFAPISEELLKAVVLWALIFNPRFRYLVDGAVYGIAVGIGFALSENMFIYLPGAGDAVLSVALSRTLSTSLVHATASGVIGIGLGRMRRAVKSDWTLMLVVHIAIAIALHGVYNWMAGSVSGPILLLFAVGIGFGGGGVIGVQIFRGLGEEKKRFSETLGLEVDNFGGERQAVVRLGGAGIERVFGELSEYFGTKDVDLMRRLLALQANIGILRNNLNGQASDRLRKAWQEEISELEAQVVEVRRALAPSARLFLGRVFPAGDEMLQDVLNEELAASDPTLVHYFDMFMRVSGLAETFTPDQLVEMAERLNRISIFRNVSLANLENLSRAIKVQEFEDGTMLFDQGVEGSAMYLIETGEIDIYVRETAEKQRHLRTFVPGQVIGEFSLLDGEPRSARAVARGHVRTLTLKREEFNLFIQSRPQVVFAMLQYLADKARHTTEAVEVAVKSMAQIGRGEYETLAAASQETVVDLAPEDVTAETPEQVGMVFSAVAAEFQQRERDMQASSKKNMPAEGLSE